MNRLSILFKAYGARLLMPLEDKLPIASLAAALGTCIAAYVAYKGLPLEFVEASLITTGLYMNKLARNAQNWDGNILQHYGIDCNVRRHANRIRTAGNVLMTLTSAAITAVTQRRFPNTELAGAAAVATLALGALTQTGVNRRGGWRQLLRATR